MPELTGHAQIFHSNTSIVDSSLKGTLGRRGVDKNGNEYVYLLGIASTVAGNWVTFNEDYETALLTAGAVGSVAIAMAAITADEYGWYQIFGINTIAKTDTISANKALYIDDTDGRVDDLGISGDLVLNAYSKTASTDNVATVSINYPSVSNDIGGVNFADEETPSGTINGSNPTFTLANSPSPTGSLQLVLNGSTQKSGGEDFTLSGDTITFVIVPPSGSTLLSWYRF